MDPCDNCGELVDPSVEIWDVTICSICYRDILALMASIVKVNKSRRAAIAARKKLKVE